MPRQIEFSGSAADCTRLLLHLQEQTGIARLLRQNGVALMPEGDVVTIEAANEACRDIMNTLSDLGLLHAGAVSISEPNATIRAETSASINEEGNDAIWEEIGAMMRQDTNPSFNFLALMAVAGAVATFGIVSETIHVVVGAMLIAPGFEPLLRIVFGIGGHKHSAFAGLRSTAAGYLALAIAAAVATPVALYFVDVTADELARGYWANYWTTIKPDGVATSALAGIAGGIIVSSRLKVLATGVMVALALIPSMALVGIGFATANIEMVAGAASRWAVESACVVFCGGAVILVKRRQHRR